MPPSFSVIADSETILAAEYSRFSPDFNDFTVKSVRLKNLKGFALVKIYAASINPADAVLKNPL